MSTGRGFGAGVARRLVARWEAILFLIFVAVIVFNSFASPYFLDPANLLDTTFSFMEKAIIALPLTLGIILNDIDISVAGIVALSSLGSARGSPRALPTGCWPPGSAYP
jgi:rhamnose transport system permease protein